MTKITRAGTIIFFDRMKRLLVGQNGPLEAQKAPASGPSATNEPALGSIRSSVRYRGVDYDVLWVAAGGDHCLLNRATGNALILTRAQKLSAIMTGELAPGGCQ